MKKIGSGKVREIYEVDEKHLMLVASDRISAFDVIMNEMVEDKGKILSQTSEFWFHYTEGIVKNHMISTNPKDFPNEFKEPEFYGRSMLVKKLKILPIECVVRGYITGSGWESYKKDGTVCGIKLQEHLRESQKLEEPIFTPSTKAEKGHDESIHFEQVCKLIGNDLAKLVREKSIEIYTKCAEYALSKGIIIADTKFEFGLDENHELILADELLTPDSSRFWPLDDYEVGRSQNSFDKQYLRDYLKSCEWDKKPPAPNLPKEVIEVTRNKYIESYERLTGKDFVNK